MTIIPVGGRWINGDAIKYIEIDDKKAGHIYFVDNSKLKLEPNDSDSLLRQLQASIIRANR